MRVNLILAVSANGVIGADGATPWDLPEGLARFNELTSGCPVIMGRKTWDSLPAAVRLMPGRSNLVLTRQAEWQAPCAIAKPSLQEALDHCRAMAKFGDTDDVWIIGGAQVYQEALPMAARVEVTLVDIIVHGDTYAPVFSSKDWRIAGRVVQQSVTGVGFSFMSFRRKLRAVA